MNLIKYPYKNHQLVTESQLINSCYRSAKVDYDFLKKSLETIESYEALIDNCRQLQMNYTAGAISGRKYALELVSFIDKYRAIIEKYSVLVNNYNDKCGKSSKPVNSRLRYSILGLSILELIKQSCLSLENAYASL